MLYICALFPPSSQPKETGLSQSNLRETKWLEQHALARKVQRSQHPTKWWSQYSFHNKALPSWKETSNSNKYNNVTSTLYNPNCNLEGRNYLVVSLINEGLVLKTKCRTSCIYWVIKCGFELTSLFLSFNLIKYWVNIVVVWVN